MVKLRAEDELPFNRRRNKCNKKIIRKKSKDATRDHIKPVARKGEEKEIFRINSQNETIDVNRFNIIYILRLSHFGGFCCILTTTRAENFMFFFGC